MIVWPSVVFPQPDSPTSPNVSPGLIANETSSTARIVSFFPPSNPPPEWKYFFKFSTRRISEPFGEGSSAASIAVAVAEVVCSMCLRNPFQEQRLLLVAHPTCLGTSTRQAARGPSRQAVAFLHTWLERAGIAA